MTDFIKKLKKARLFANFSIASLYLSPILFIIISFTCVNIQISDKLSIALMAIPFLPMLIAIELANKNNNFITDKNAINIMAQYPHEFEALTQTLKKNGYLEIVEKMQQMSSLAKNFTQLDTSSNYFINNKDRIEKRYYELYKEVCGDLVYNVPKLKYSTQEEKKVEDLVNTFFFTLGEIDKKEINVVTLEEEKKVLKNSM